MGHPIVTFADDEYVQGVGDLTLRIDRIHPLETKPGWALVGGVTVSDETYRYIWVPIAVLRARQLVP